MDSQLRKVIDAETKFANAVYQNFKALRFGLTPCCVLDEESAKIDKALCDWNDLTERTKNVGTVSTDAISEILVTDGAGVTTWTSVNIEELLERIEVLETTTLVDEKDLNYVHTQINSSTIWTIVHNLGKKPSVRIEDPNGVDIVGEITYISDAIVEIRFLTAIAGTAYLN